MVGTMILLGVTLTAWALVERAGRIRATKERDTLAAEELLRARLEELRERAARLRRDAEIAAQQAKHDAEKARAFVEKTRAESKRSEEEVTTWFNSQ